MPRFAALVLAFDVNHFLIPMLENVGPHVEKIYVAWSEFPWTYNPAARDDFRNPTSPDLIEQSAYRHKIELVAGSWETDEAQRNACLDRAVADGFDYLIVQDADEFLDPPQYPQALETIAANPDVELFRFTWINFWKSTRYALTDRSGSVFTGTPEFALNLRKGVRFVDRRITSAQTQMVLPTLCFHLGYVGDDQRIFTKIKTWSHAHEFNADRWFQQKWLRWNPRVRHLHPVVPTIWPRAVPYTGPLPELLRDWPHNNHGEYHETAPHAFARWHRDSLTPARLRLARYRRALARRITPKRGSDQ